ncbi:MAG: methionine--tRNA ligase [Vicinamibacterales bacterium]
MSKFYLTTAIDYVNSRPHLGTAYEKIAADVIARYKRLSGVDTRFMMGNDEHSQNVFQRARELNKDPLTFCDEMETAFREVWGRLDISFDDFIRTTESRHRTAVTTLVSRIADAGDIYEGFYEGWYCVSCEAFKQEKDLIDGNCPVHQKPPNWIKEKNYFFRLSRYQQRLRAHYDQHPEFLEPESRRNEILRLIEAGLEDISISRTGQAWGIPLPSDPESVVYVWVDALINYASAVGYGVDDSLFAKWWPADLHVIGKDITRFHCVVWPAMLMSAELPLPGQVFGHGWVHWRGQKMSKSLGTVVDPLEAADRLGPDPLRFYLTKEIAFGQDGDFTWERFEERYNVDLANNFGNLVSRVVSMVHRYRQGRLVVPPREPGPLAARATDTVAAYREAMDSYALQQGIEAVFSLVDATNEYITTVEPWVVAKDPGRGDELDRQLCDMAESVRIAATLLSPVMPGACCEVLGRVGTINGAHELDLDRDGVWTTPPGAERYLVKGPALWPRLEEGDLTMDENEAQKPIQEKKEPVSVVADSPSADSPEEARISIDDFFKVKLRVGRIAVAEAVPKSKKLLRLDVETGSGVRQIVSGIAKSYTPDSLVGRHVVYVENLKPAKLMGIESNGMVLAATDANGEAVLIEPEDVTRAPAGSEVK